MTAETPSPRGLNASRSAPPPLWPWVAAALASWAVASFLYLQLPARPDQYDHAYVAWRILSGAVPYRDIIDVNWPGVLALHALALLAFGIHEWSWRAFDLLLFAPAVLCLADIVRRSAGPRAGWIALLLSPWLYAAAGTWMAGQKDMTAAQLALGALWCHLRAYESGRWRWQTATGALLALAVLNKPTFAVLALLLPLHAWLHGQGMRRVAEHCAAGAAGLAALLALFAGGLFRLGTSLQELREATLVYAAHVKGGDSLSRLLDGHGAQWSGLFVTGLAAWYLALRGSQRSMASTALPLLWFAGWISALAQLHGHGYHLSAVYLATMGTLAILLSLAAAPPPGTGALRRTVLLACALATVLGLAGRIGWLYRSLPAALFAGRGEVFLSQFRAEVDGGLTMADVARFVRQLDEEPDRGCLFFVGEGSAINVLASRPRPTRFYYLPMIQNAVAPLPMAERWNALWTNDLAHSDCRYVLVLHARHAAWLASEHPAAVALRALLVGYRQVGTLGSDGAVWVYRRDAAVGSGGAP